MFYQIVYKKNTSFHKIIYKIPQIYLQNILQKYLQNILQKKEHHFLPPNSLIFIGFIGFVIWFKVRVEAFDKRFGPRLLTAFWSISWSILWTICRSISQRTLGWLTCSHNWNQFEKKSQFFCAPFGVRFSCCKPHKLRCGLVPSVPSNSAGA